MSTYRVPSRLAYVVPDDGERACAFLMRLPDGLPLALYDTAAIIWVLAADGEEDIAAAVGNAVDVAPADITAEVATFLAELVAKGLLEFCQ